jgi:hypothetical protein
MATRDGRWSGDVAKARLFNSVSYTDGSPSVTSALIAGEAQGMWGVEIRRVEAVTVSTQALKDQGAL